ERTDRLRLRHLRRTGNLPGRCRRHHPLQAHRPAHARGHPHRAGAPHPEPENGGRHMMRLPWLARLAFCCLPLTAAAMALALPAPVQAQQAIDPLPFKDRAEEVRFQKLAGQLRCLVCQDESLLESNAELAQQMRQIAFRKMQQGWSDDRIKQYFVDRYSDYVLYKPPLRP